jgi:MFS family permease
MVGSFINQMGTQMTLVAVTFWLKELTSSARLIGLFTASSALPLLLFSPLGGVFADRLSRRKSLMVCDAVCGAISFCLLFLLKSMIPIPMVIYGVFGVSFLLSSVAAFASPAFNAFIPDLVSPRDLSQAMSVAQISGLIAIMTGQSLGGLLLSHFAPYVLLGIDGFTYWISVIGMVFMCGVSLYVTPHPKSFGVDQLWSGIREGFEYLWNKPDMRMIIGSSIPFNFFSMPIFVFLPFYTSNVLGEPLSKYGYLLAFFSVGLLIGYGLGGYNRIRPIRIASVATGCIFGNSLICLVLSVNHSFYLATLLLVLFGFGNGMISMLSVNSLLAQTRIDKRGRVISILIMVTQGFMPLTMAFVGVIGDMLRGNVRPLYAGCGGFLLVMALVAFSNQEFTVFFRNAQELKFAPSESDKDLVRNDQDDNSLFTD